MDEKLMRLEARYEELSVLLSQPDAMEDQAAWRKLMREQSQLQPIMDAYRLSMQTARHVRDTEALLTDPDLADIAREELPALQALLSEQRQALEVLLLPQDPNDLSNVVMEIRAGAGGDEASLFGAVLMRMYTRYAERHGWKMELIDANMTELGGVKEATFLIIGQGAFKRLKFESGVHRVQRVPTTESGGRIHTSTATVAVLPEVEDVEITIQQSELRVDVYRSSGHGGQCVNTTDSAVRITHLPTGLVVTCQDEKSQIKNREKAMRVLKSRLYDHVQSQKDAEYALQRKRQVGTGDRSERIRTYNFPQGRVTDHRIGMTMYQIDSFIDGDCDEMITGLLMADEAERLKSLAQ